MSTPERQQDPGEHGYGGTKQGFPTEERRRPQDRPEPEEVDRIEVPEAAEPGGDEER